MFKAGSIKKYFTTALILAACLTGAMGSPKGGSIVKVMVKVPAGEFMMGCNEKLDDKCYYDEKPYHKVHLDAFLMDKFAVTVGEYESCVEAGKCTQAHFDDGECHFYSGIDWRKGEIPPSFKEKNKPIVCVDWRQAKSYCESVGKKLPTEAQWEKAARGTDGRVYPWGTGKPTCEVASMDEGGWGCGDKSTQPVDAKPKGASPYGAVGMVGNTWEWTADWYSDKYYKNSPAKNPKGPKKGDEKVIRGGSWLDEHYSLRTSIRYRVALDGGDYDLGFRCAKDGK